MIEATTEDIIVDIDTNIDVSSTGSIDVVTTDNKDLDITVTKKEFVITGDDIYVPVLYDDVPQWMKDLVSLSVNQAIEGVSTDNLDQLNSMLSEFATSYVPLNQYTESILDLSNADVSLHALIETLNSTYNDGINNANSQINTLENTKASKDEVVAQVINTLAAQLATPGTTLASTIARLDQAITTSNNANATSYTALNSAIDALDGTVQANADASNLLKTYVGMNDAGASANTGLSAYLVDSTTGIVGGANSKVGSGVYVKSDGTVSSKWAYDSAITVNGTTYNSGFGLATSVNNPSIPVGTSEFWITADKFKISSPTNNRYQPFSISGNNIVFNGKVSFNNVNGVPTHSSGTTSPTVGTNPNGLADGSTYYNTSTKSGYIISGGVWINNSSVTDTSALVPEATITSTSLPGSTIKNQGTIWRYQPNASMARYTHYISKGGGVWTELGGTYIDGSNIVTGSIDSARLNVNDIFSQNITYTGTITGGSGGLGGKIKSYNGAMEIDLVNGSIYIA